MVDKDRLSELTGGSSGGSSKKSKSKKKSSKRKKKKKKKSTKKDKLSAFKSTKKPDSQSSEGGTEDVKRLLFALANMQAYTRVLVDFEPDGLNPAQMEIKSEYAEEVSNEIVNFLGVFRVKDIDKKYGYQWSNILDIVIDNNDVVGKTLRTNSGDVDDEDIKELLECIANIILFVEGSIRAKENKDKQNMRDKTVLFVAESMYEEYKNIISQTKVQMVAERHGYDWQDDILKGVLENQDFSSKLKR